MSRSRQLLLARLLVCLAVALCSLAAELLLCVYVIDGGGASARTTVASPVRSQKAGSSGGGNAIAKPPLSPDTPIRLAISAADINAAVEMLTFQANGDLATPTRNPWGDVGWYEQGSYPGHQGSSVIDGHLDRPGGFPAVFWRLGEVKPGTDVQVTLLSGKLLHFRVTAVMYYPPDQAPIQEIFGNQNGYYLNLITCAGDWIPSQHQTNLRLVVYTTLILPS